uniref:DTHCT domain-containing protein n=1 Tax=Lutzomyia longipalpis TaxID=7200 RepID=A0A1B0CES6_LUTLO
MVKKYEKATQVGVKKEKAEKKKKVKGEGADEEMDDLDALVNAGDNSIKKEDKPAKKTKKAAGDGLKQTKISFPKEKKKKAKSGAFGSSDEDEVNEVSPPARERAPMRAASKKIVYKFDSDQEEDDAASDVFGDSDSDDELKPISTTNQSSEDMFDSLKEDNGQDSPAKAPPAAQPAAAKRKLNKPPAAAKVTKRTKKDQSSSDEEVFSKKARKKDELSSDDDFSPVKKPSRGAKKATYAESDDDSDY